MEDKNKKDINRRDFIKIVGISAATSTGLLYGCSSKGTSSSSSATGEGEVPTDKMTYRREKHKYLLRLNKRYN